MNPQYQLQIRNRNTWEDCGPSNRRYEPVRQLFAALAASMQSAQVPIGYALRVIDKSMGHMPKPYDEWERVR